MIKIKPVDAVIILISAILITFLFVQTYSSPSDSAELLVRVDEESWRYTLDEDRILFIPGPLGDTEIHIHDGEVFVEDSPCNSKICVAAGKIRRPGQWIVCLPNRVFISIEGVVDTGKEEVDDVVF
ncbi:MAG: NusG domain II-containing protein [Spirochaetales bacterium]|nr:NusG domain II-containing protein [Spirochaetales bacterium]